MTDAGETSTQRWTVDTMPWLTPIERQRVWDADRAIEGITGKVAALLYGILEARMMYYVAHLAILEGDRHIPQVRFRPADFWCEEDGVDWHSNDRFLVVRVPLSKKRFWRTDYAVAPCVFDLSNQTFTFVPLPIGKTYFSRLARSDDGWTVEESGNRPASVPSHAGEHFRDHELRWAPWDELATRGERFFAGWFGKPR